MNAPLKAVALRPMNIKSFKFTIEGISPLIQHAWTEKAMRQIREKQAGKKTKERAVRDPQGEAEAATHRTDDGQYGVPLLAIKASLIGAAHKDLGIEKTLVRKALFIRGGGSSLVIPMRCSDPILREDLVRVGMDAPDLRYRHQFNQWEVDIEVDYDTDLLQVQDIINLAERAGFGGGIGEWRPEKGGEFGRYRVKV